MSATVIAFPAKESNGAREALIDILKRSEQANPEGRADVLLTLLWYEGFKIMPLEGNE